MDDTTNLEPLQEVTTIAAGNAATALAKLIGQEVRVALPSVKLVAVEKILTEIGDVAHVSAAALVKIEGDMRGLLLFTLDPGDAQQVTEDVVNKQANGIFVDPDQTVLRETANIVGGAALSAIATFSGLKLMQSVPASTTDMVGAILDSFIAEFGTKFDKALVLQEVFTLTTSGTSLKMLSIIDPPSTMALLAKLTNLTQPGHATDPRS